VTPITVKYWLDDSIIGRMRTKLLKKSIYLLAAYILAYSNAVFATESLYDEEALAQQRKEFLDGKKAVRKGQLSNYKRISERLKDYPLYGYLEYEYLRKRVHRVPDQLIKRFIDTYSDSPISSRLRSAWLRHLARKGRWNKFLEEYQPGSSTKLRCSHALALFKVGRKEDAMAEVDRLWLTSKSQPRSCDRVFAEWKKHGGMNNEMIWKRIELAMEKSRTSLAVFLAKSLPKSDREWVDRWVSMHRNPARNLHRKVYRLNRPEARLVYRHGVERLARRDAGAAADAWDQVREDHFELDADAAHAVDQYVALSAASQKHPRALELMARLERPNERTLDWRVRAALTQQDWWTALTWIEGLPADLRDTDQWRYWRARILEMQSRNLPALRTAAERIFSSLAEQRSYHGFLAADRIGVPYELESRPLVFTDDQLREVAKLPAIQRAYELFKLKKYVEARREWFLATNAMSDRELQKVSVLASRWGWHDRAIMTVAKSDHYDDLEMRFPIVFEDEIRKNADSRKIDPAWIYGVLRQESSFMVDARSGAGALGLMQLMPRTGRMTARYLNSRIRSTREILEVSKNITLGSAYLRRMLDRNSGHSALATASYNAGPHRVGKWMPKDPIAADLWVESIPFTETRNYVQRVMAYTVIYDFRLDGEAAKMRSRMPVVNPLPSS